MTEHRTLAEAFLAAHCPGRPLLLPNAWDVGTARLFANEGFEAVATTSGGFAATLGRRDGSVTRDEAIGHGADLAAAIDVPVTADLEDGFAETPEGVAETVRQAVDAGLAGCSIEDWSGGDGAGIHPLDRAVERVAAAVEAAHSRDVHLVLTARAENHIHGVDDLSDTIARLQAYEAAGADVLYAPGLIRPDDIRSVVAAVSRPVNVLLLPGGPTVAQLADLGVARISVGGAFHLVAMGAVLDAARSLRSGGPHEFWPLAKVGRAGRDASLS